MPYTTASRAFELKCGKIDAAVMAEVANDINSWRQSNNSFLNKIQYRLLLQNETLTEQNPKLRLQEKAQASLDAKCTALIGDQKQLKEE